MGTNTRPFGDLVIHYVASSPLPQDHNVCGLIKGFAHFASSAMLSYAGQVDMNGPSVHIANRLLSLCEARLSYCVELYAHRALLNSAVTCIQHVLFQGCPTA